MWEWNGREPFGFQRPNEDPDGNSTYFKLNLRFPGQWADEETGLYHNGFRDYHPNAGRYIQSDPLGLEAGWNTYAYVGSNPVNEMDLFGLIQKNKDGSIRFDSSGEPYEYCIAGGASCVMWTTGFIYTDLGNLVAVEQYVSGDVWFARNCHGFALDLPFWINDPRQIYADEYRENENGKISAYWRNGYIDHSEVHYGPFRVGKSGIWGPLPMTNAFQGDAIEKRYEKK